MNKQFLMIISLSSTIHEQPASHPRPHTRTYSPHKCLRSQPPLQSQMTPSHLPSSASVEIEPRQLLPRILDVFLRLHAHVEDRAILAAANDFAMHAPLAALTLGPQASEADLQLGHLGEGFRVQFARARAAVFTDGTCHFGGGDERFFAAHTGLGFFGKFHEPAEGGCGDGDGAGMLAREELAGLFFAEDGVEDAAEGFGELVVEVVFRVDGDVVLEDEDGVFGALVIFGAAGAFDDNIGDAVAEGWGGAGVALFHAFGEFDVGLFGGVVGFGEGFCDDKFGHVNFVLEEVGNSVFDVARPSINRMVLKGKSRKRKTYS